MMRTMNEKALLLEKLDELRIQLDQLEISLSNAFEGVSEQMFEGQFQEMKLLDSKLSSCERIYSDFASSSVKPCYRASGVSGGSLELGFNQR